MAGASIEVTFDDAEVLKAINRLVASGKDLTPAMRDIGEHLLKTTQQRFFDEQAPDGTPWAPLTETTLQRKRRNVGKILTEYANLRGPGLDYQARQDQVEVGSPLIYAGTHQFGAARGTFGLTAKGEPYRVSRRPQTLRDWAHETFKQILPGASGTGSAVGPGPPGRAQNAMGSHRFGVVEGGLFGRDAAQVGSSS